jgi:nucleoside-diphosphate-sugar epimerase
MITHQRVLIVGCGYVGTAVGKELAGQGHRVTGTTRNARRTPALEAAGIRHAVLDLEDESRLTELVRDADVVCFTVAAGREKQNYRDVYLEGIRRLLRAANGSPIQHIIYTSATSVYGQTDGSWIDETAPTEPLTDNGRVLVETEAALLAGAHQLRIPAAIFRLAGIYGPGRDPLAWFKRQDTSRPRRHPDAYLNMIHIDDIAQALAAAVTHRIAGVMNLSDDEPMLRRELYTRLCARAGLPEPHWPEPDDKSPADLGKRVRNDQAKRLLGLQLLHPTR